MEMYRQATQMSNANIQSTGGTINTRMPQAVEAESECELELRRFDSIDEVRDALEETLEAFLDITHQFCYAKSFPDAPNPRIYIVGHGDLDLPLQGHTVRASVDLSTVTNLAATASNNPSDPSRARHVKWPKFWFENPAWKNYVQFDIVQDVCETLGIDVVSSPPRCDLDRLVIVEPGSRFALDSNSEQNVEGLMARILIILPSDHEGGSLRLSHDGQVTNTSNVPDFASAVRVIAWYASVSQEAGPVTSGCMLALSYNLIHTGSTPIPRPVSTSQVSNRLRSTLTSWNNSKLPHHYDNYISYLFKEKYKETELQKGVKMLKGRDALLVQHLLPVLEESDFGCWVAMVTCKIKGLSNGGPYWRKKFDEDSIGEPVEGDEDDDEDEDEGEGEEEDDHDWEDEYDPEDGISYSFGMDRFGDIDYEEIRVTALHELDGEQIVITEDPITPDDSHLIPKNPFKSTRPDEIKAAEMGYSRKHWYYRPALLILPGSSGFVPILDTVSTEYPLKKMTPLGNGPPSRLDRILANGQVDGHPPISTEMIADYAVQWDDLELWNRALVKGERSIAYWGLDRFVAGWKKWGFEAVRASYEALAASREPLDSRLTFLKGILSSASPEERERVRLWASEQAIGTGLST